MRKQYTIVVYLIALFSIALHLFVYNNLEYHRDELLYFSLGNHPDFGYATVPPLIGWIATAMQTFLGNTLFAVKLFPAIIGGATVLVSANIARELKGGMYSQVLTAIAIALMPVGLRAFHLFQPVPIDIFLWTLLFFFTLRYVNTKQEKYLLILGIVTGIALMNKYLVAILIFTLLISLLVSPHRNVLGKRLLYFGILLALLIVLPNLIWQYANNFPVIGHMAALNNNQLVYVDRTGFLMEQMLMTFSVFYLVVIGMVRLYRDPKYRYLAVSSLLVVLILFLLKGKSYYTAGIFPMLIAAGCTGMERITRKPILRAAVPLLIVVLTYPLLPMGLPVYNEAGLVTYFKDLEEDYGMEIGRRFEDGTIHSLPQDYADMLGWEELTAITYEAYGRIPEKDKALIYAENYGQAGAITVIGKKYGLPEPVSFHESFYYWTPEKFDPDIEYFVYINDELGEDIPQIFSRIEEIGSISNINAREFGTKVYLCSEPKGSFNTFWTQVLQRVNDPF